MKKADKLRPHTIPIACATDEEYAPYLSAMLESLALGLNERSAASVTVMHMGLSEETVKGLVASSRGALSVRCVDVSDMLLPYRNSLRSRCW